MRSVDLLVARPVARGWKLRSGPPPKAPRGAGALITCGRPEELERERAMNMLEQAEETAARLCGGLLTLEVAQCRAALAAIKRVAHTPGSTTGCDGDASAWTEAAYAVAQDDVRVRRLRIDSRRLA